MSRTSSLDLGYVSGDLSVFPEARDNTYTLFQATNNAETTLKQSVTYSGKTIVVDDTSKFPDFGIIRVGPKAGQPGPAELMYYDSKTSSTFQKLQRGYAGSRQNQWAAGSAVTGGVMAEHHNAVKDAILKIQGKMGLEDFPDANSLNGILKFQEIRFLAPKPLFRSFPINGPPPLKVTFQNFSGGDVIRSLWDFGDGSQSVEKNPIHTYQAEGIYTVRLSVITSTGAQGVSTKSNYITVSQDSKIPFFYVTPVIGYSVQTAAARTLAGNPTNPTDFLLVDQTDGSIVNRYWVFDDGESVAYDNPNIHTTTHQYAQPGVYEPSLLVVFSSQQLKRVFVTDKVVVL
jgi:PKD repeat protein